MTDDFVSLCKRFFDYDPISGDITRLDPGVDAYDSLKGYKIASRFFNTVVTNTNGKGYINISLKGKSYLGHRIAWVIHTGIDPINDIDHEDGNRTNNKIDNLREATRSQNCINKGIKSTNTSGYKGVGWHKATNKWYASININKKRVHLGTFTDILEAHNAYEKASKEHHKQFRKGNK